MIVGVLMVAVLVALVLLAALLIVAPVIRGRLTAPAHRPNPLVARHPGATPAAGHRPRHRR